MTAILDRVTTLKPTLDFAKVGPVFFYNEGNVILVVHTESREKFSDKALQSVLPKVAAEASILIKQAVFVTLSTSVRNNAAIALHWYSVSGKRNNVTVMPLQTRDVGHVNFVEEAGKSLQIRNAAKLDEILTIFTG